MRHYLTSLKVLLPAAVIGIITGCVFLIVDVHQKLSLYKKEIEWLELYVRSLDGSKMEKQGFLTDKTGMAEDLYENNLVIIYNKVPKSGSTSLSRLAYDLCSPNNFHVVHVDTQRYKPVLSTIDRYDMVRNISLWTAVRPAFFHGHFAYLHFAMYSSPLQPIYINLVREPLDRFISYYYFLRFGDDLFPNQKRSRASSNESLDDCVQRNGKDCSETRLWLQVPFFCGQAPACWEPGSSWALEQAKRNVVDRYFLVGVTEMMDEFVLLLEHALPRFFSGASKTFHASGNAHLRKTKQKLRPAEATIAKLKSSRSWKLEQDFYEFVRAHFRELFARTFAVNENENLILFKGLFSYDKIRPALHRH